MVCLEEQPLFFSEFGFSQPTGLHSPDVDAGPGRFSRSRCHFLLEIT